MARELFGQGRCDARKMARFTQAAARLVDGHGRATPELQRIIFLVEKRYSAAFSAAARELFTSLVAQVGGKLLGPLPLPKNRVPYWLKDPHPLANFQSTPRLPRRADVVVIGAGLTGAAAAYYLSLQLSLQSRQLDVVILDAGDPATQASGRNGGNFELIPENFFGDYGSYDGLAKERQKFLKNSYPTIADSVLWAQAQRSAAVIIRFALQNAARMLEVIADEEIDCDLSQAGWLRIAMNRREEAALKDEVKLARSLGANIRLLSAETIRTRYGMPTNFSGRIVYGNGNYHPFKLVCGELRCALSRGVKLYTRTLVSTVRSLRADHHEVVTARGTIRAKKVIVATNAFTAQLYPELADIRYFRSQIANFEHVVDPLRGITMTAKDGDIYANFPAARRYMDAQGIRRGTLHVGGGKDVPARDPWRPIPSRAVWQLSQAEVAHYFPDSRGQPASRLWAGPMAFVEGKHGMRLPVLGPLGQGARQGVFIAVWCNGYGGSGCHNAGAGAAEWATTGKVPSSMPQDVFGPARLFSDAPQFI